MSPLVLILILLAYFAVLIVISRVQSREADFNDFYNASKNAPWLVVAFGMIGASLSGVTFISVPGWVGERSLSYMQMVFGYFIGYIVIAHVLLPIYYRSNLQSIYVFLGNRIGAYAHYTGSGFFLLSRSIGAAFRLYLVAIVLQRFIFEPLGIPFVLTVGLTILLIWMYTYRSGIKTIIWTDTLQTGSMLIVLLVVLWKLSTALDIQMSDLPNKVLSSSYGQVFFFEDGWSDPYNFFKQVLGGMFITIVMTGLDQDMMQKNLACRSLKDAQKNMFLFSLMLILINFLFLSLGVLLYLFLEKNGLAFPSEIVMGREKVLSDLIFPTVAMEHFGSWTGALFFIGLIAAAYSSADSALTSLTTSFCVDVLRLNPNETGMAQASKVRRWTHVGFSLVLFLIVCIFRLINDQAVIGALFQIAGYTYGPLLGMFAYGLLVRKKLNSRWVAVIAVLSPIFTFIINTNSAKWFAGYTFDFELLILNGFICFLGMFFYSLFHVNRVTAKNE